MKKAIIRLNFPLHAELGGESIKAINKIIKDYKLPKYSRIGFTRTISVIKDLEYDLTEVFIEK